MWRAQVKAQCANRENDRELRFWRGIGQPPHKTHAVTVDDGIAVYLETQLDGNLPRPSQLHVV
jgi:hypothetical protein